MTPEQRAAIANGEKQPIPAPGWMRITMRVAMLLAALLFFVPLHYLCRIFSSESSMPKYFLKTAAHICGARTTKHGAALQRDVVFLSNHVSWLDILVQAGASGTAFVAKAEVQRAPLVGWLAGLNRTVYVERRARRDIASQIDAVREAMAQAWTVTIFPEGTTTNGQSLLPFKSSLLKMLEPPPPGVMVQPVVINYGENAEDIGWVGDESGLHNALRILARRGSFPVRLTYLDPFDPAALQGGRKAISARAREAIEARLMQELGKPMPEPARDMA